MRMLRTLMNWLLHSNGNAEKLAFKDQREAVEFVRRVYDENGAPNARLREVYRRGQESRANESASVALRA